MFNRWNQSIGLRFTLFSFLLVILISIGFITLESYLSLKREFRRLNTQISQIEQSHVSSIVYSLWLTDYDLLLNQLEAIVRFPHIRYIEVRDDEGRIFKAGNSNSDLTVHSIDLHYTRRGTEFFVGSMNIHINEKELRASVLKTELVSVLGHLLTACLIAGTMAALFKKQVGRHINRLARYVHESKEPDIEKSFHLERKKQYDDELQRLVEAVNAMRKSLNSHIIEREMLMKEVHHRIKNDLSFIMAFLALQAEQTRSSEAENALKEASQRVYVMSHVYKQLYSHGDLSTVELSSVIKNVVNDVVKKGDLLPENFTILVDNVEAPIRISVAFGIILNELLTNAVKYSAVADKRLKIDVSLTADNSQQHLAVLTVKDNGEGFPKNVLRGNDLGYGLSFVKALVEQHRGVFSLYNQNGANVNVLI